MRKHRNFSVVAAVFLCGFAMAGKAPVYEPVDITDVFSKLIVRSKKDRVCSGQITSTAGLARFMRDYGVDLKLRDMDFTTQMLVFGITEKIYHRALRVLRQQDSQDLFLDYSEIQMAYELERLDAQRKYSHLQIFRLVRIDDIADVQVMGSPPGATRVYDNGSHNKASEATSQSSEPQR